MNASELSTRSDQVELAAFGGGAPDFGRVLHGEAAQPAWRIVDVFSRSAKPFACLLEWSGGSGGGASARIVCARATRISVFARNLKVSAANLSGGTNQVQVNVADGYADTQNTWEERGTGTGVPQNVPIPELAVRARLEIDDPGMGWATFIDIEDGLATLRSRVSWNEQPPDGVPLAGAGALKVTVSATDNWRVVFGLAL